MTNPIISLYVRAQMEVARKRNELRNRMTDKGAGLVEYGALIILAVAVLAAIVGSGLIETVEDSVGDAVEDLFDRGFTG